MKKLIFIFLFSFLCFSNIKAEEKDTCKTQTVRFDNTSVISKSLYGGFVAGNLDNIIMFCDSYVEFSFQKNSQTTLSEIMTDYRALENLNDLLNELKYTRFSISTAKTYNLETVFLVKVFLLPNSDEYNMNILFVLNQNGAISKFIIY